MTEKRVWCGVCEASCGLIATVEDGRLVALAPDPDHPQSLGFACPKGTSFGDVLSDPDRLRHPVKRNPDGSFARVSWDEALDDIGARLRAVIKGHGRESSASGWATPTRGTSGPSSPCSGWRRR